MIIQASRLHPAAGPYRRVRRLVSNPPDGSWHLLDPGSPAEAECGANANDPTRNQFLVSGLEDVDLDDVCASCIREAGKPIFRGLFPVRADGTLYLDIKSTGSEVRPWNWQIQNWFRAALTKLTYTASATDVTAGFPPSTKSRTLEHILAVTSLFRIAKDVAALPECSAATRTDIHSLIAALTEQTMSLAPQLDDIPDLEDITWFATDNHVTSLAHRPPFDTMQFGSGAQTIDGLKDVVARIRASSQPPAQLAYETDSLVTRAASSAPITSDILDALPEPRGGYLPGETPGHAARRAWQQQLTDSVSELLTATISAIETDEQANEHQPMLIWFPENAGELIESTREAVLFRQAVDRFTVIAHDWQWPTPRAGTWHLLWAPSPIAIWLEQVLESLGLQRASRSGTKVVTWPRANHAVNSIEAALTKQIPLSKATMAISFDKTWTVPRVQAFLSMSPDPEDIGPAVTVTAELAGV